MKPYGTISSYIKTSSIIGDSCEVCTLYEAAEQQIGDSLLCPHCGQEVSNVVGINYYPHRESQAIGQKNSVEEQFFVKLDIFECRACRNLFSLLPIPITYNGNHDIYYTGAGTYLGFDESTEELRKLLRSAFKDQEIKGTDEEVDPDFLGYWLEGEATRILARYLVDQGFTKAPCADIGDGA